jgi:regulator of protease activity HflC (stomatin/prohibitin superfamily)
MLIFGVVGALVVVMLVALARSAFRIEEGERGVVTRFGAALKRNGTLVTHGPGLHFKAPWDVAHRVSIRERALELLGDKRQRVMAEDGTVLRLDASVRYQLNEQGIEPYLFKPQRPAEHINALVRCLLRSEIANLTKPSGDVQAKDDNVSLIEEAAGAYGVIRRERQLLNARLSSASKVRLRETCGVDFQGVDLVDILPPDELADALNAVMNAKSEADVALYRAESESRQQVLSAEQSVDIARVQAKAVASEIDRLGVHLQQLDSDGVLTDYVERRQDEVLSESRTVYVNAPGAK